jgi:hypothetical protein
MHFVRSCSFHNSVKSDKHSKAISLDKTLAGGWSNNGDAT